MYFNKYPSAVNFRYADDLRHRAGRKDAVSLESRTGCLTFSLVNDDVLRIASTLSRARTKSLSTAELSLRAVKSPEIVKGRKGIRLKGVTVEVAISEKTGEFEFLHHGMTALRSASLPFGVCGTKSIAVFDRPKEGVVYGLGEKTGGLDKANKSYKMWNIDAAFDFLHTFTRDDYDPTYVTIPFYISRYEDTFFGVLLDNPYSTFVHAGLKPGNISLIPTGLGRNDLESVFALGADDGLFELYVIPGPTLGDVVRRFARLTGRHEMPPLWALGYHQCRWGYKSAKELAEIADELAKHKIPTGAVWADIDYMEGYRVFTYNRKNYAEKDRAKYFKHVNSTGMQLVTIIDPGVKEEPGYPIFDEGKKRDVFCKTPEDVPYIGYVWPGRTVFPDFTLPEGRAFWAKHIRRHLESGLAGIWNDMNDPSTGPVNLDDMRFQRGAIEHAAYHNQYGHLMAKATWDGFALKDPNQRPFILTRSGYTGTQKYCAIWTGDNDSNEGHLAMSIPMSINLALSGVSFNGPDVGGFAGNCPEDLMLTWMLAGALFPFFRNHSVINSRRQEPWAYSRRALSIIRNCILTRAKLLPYLYNQFESHWRTGDAVMRPVSYDFPGEKYERIGDQFLIGPSLMAAPFVRLDRNLRSVELPPGWWFDLRSGDWVRGGHTISIRRGDDMVLFVRDGAVLPCVDTNSLFPQPDFRKVSFHVFCKQHGATAEYYEDDGATRDYQKGEFNRFAIRATKRGSELRMSVEKTHGGFAQGLRAARCFFYGLAPDGAASATAKWPFRSYAVKAATVEIGDAGE